MTMTWRARCSRGHYLPAKDVHTTLGPEDWDDTCRCKTTTVELEPSGETFGHEPMDLVRTGHAPLVVCARCQLWFRSGQGWTLRPILWPCTSAMVLGLVDRTEAAW